MIASVRRHRAILITVLALAGGLLSPMAGLAAEPDGQHIAMTPSSVELAIAPGGSKASSVDVINQGTLDFSFAPSVDPYRVVGLNYDPKFTQLPGTVDASQWIKLQTTQPQILATRKIAHINYTVSVPANTAPGGYYAVVFAETSPVTPSAGVVAHNRVGEIVYLTVTGPVRLAGEVQAGKLSSIVANGRVVVPTLVKNIGGVHFKSTVTVSVKNIFGKRVFQQQRENYVLPQTQRQIDVTWASRTPIGIYRVSRTATIPSGSVKLPVKTIVLVQPWFVALVLAAVALVALKLVYYRNRSRSKES